MIEFYIQAKREARLVLNAIFAAWRDMLESMRVENELERLREEHLVLTVKADQDEDFVYNYLKAFDETYPMYKDGTAVMGRWKLENAGTPPVDVPFHPGAIKYLKEKGIWTDEMQAWNDKRLARLKALQAAWKDAIAEGKGKSDDAFADIWAKHRQQAIESL